MRLPFVIPFCWLAPLLGMDYTPPPVIPSYLREAIEKDKSEHVPMPSVLDESKRQSIHKDHTVIDIHVVDIPKRTKIGHSTKFVAITNVITGLVTASIGVGVTLAVRYSDECNT